MNLKVHRFLVEPLWLPCLFKKGAELGEPFFPSHDAKDQFVPLRLFHPITLDLTNVGES
jgi:hypothetical protein